MRVLVEAAGDVPEIMTTPAPRAMFKGFGDKLARLHAARMGADHRRGTAGAERAARCHSAQARARWNRHCLAWRGRSVSRGAPRRLRAAAGVELPARAQDIEPRAYSNAPIGVNFLIAGYAYTKGGIAFGPPLPITNPDLDTSSAVVAYARVLDVWGMSAKFDATVPYTWLSGTADYRGETVPRDVNGFANSAFRLSINLYGAPALYAEGVRRLEAGPHHRRQLSRDGAVEPVRRHEARQHRHQSLVLQTGGRDLEGHRTVDARRSRRRRRSTRTTTISSAARRFPRIRSIRCKDTRSTAFARGSGLRSTPRISPAVEQPSTAC